MNLCFQIGDFLKGRLDFLERHLAWLGHLLDFLDLRLQNFLLLLLRQNLLLDLFLLDLFLGLFLLLLLLGLFLGLFLDL